jgi:hypothetical protein
MKCCSKTLRMFLGRIEKPYGKARRVWVMDRSVPTEAVLAEMRASDPPVQYFVGTPKGRLNRLEKHLIEKPWQKAREGISRLPSLTPGSRGRRRAAWGDRASGDGSRGSHALFHRELRPGQTHLTREPRQTHEDHNLNRR